MTTTAPTPTQATPTPAAAGAGTTITNQLELGLAPATPPGRPATPSSPRPVRRPAPGPIRRQVRTRRFAVARWWFNQMRDAVVAAREWPAADAETSSHVPALATSAPQTTLDLVSPPTRLERRPLPLPLAA